MYPPLVALGVLGGSLSPPHLCSGRLCLCPPPNLGVPRCPCPSPPSGMWGGSPCPLPPPLCGVSPPPPLGSPLRAGGGPWGMGEGSCPFPAPPRPGGDPRGGLGGPQAARGRGGGGGALAVLGWNRPEKGPRLKKKRSKLARVRLSGEGGIGGHRGGAQGWGRGTSAPQISHGDPPTHTQRACGPPKGSAPPSRVWDPSPNGVCAPLWGLLGSVRAPLPQRGFGGVSRPFGLRPSPLPFARLATPIWPRPLWPLLRPFPPGS